MGIKQTIQGERYRLNKRLRVNADVATGVAYALKTVGDVSIANRCLVSL